MKFIVVTALTLLSSAAFANPAHHHHPFGEQKTLDQMTCSDAIALGKKQGYIMVRGAGNDAPVPVYPIQPEPYQINCPTPQYLKPWFLPALDTESCIINWVCIS